MQPTFRLRMEGDHRAILDVIREIEPRDKGPRGRPLWEEWLGSRMSMDDEDPDAECVGHVTLPDADLLARFMLAFETHRKSSIGSRFHYGVECCIETDDGAAVYATLDAGQWGKPGSSHGTVRIDRARLLGATEARIRDARRALDRALGLTEE